MVVVFPWSSFIRKAKICLRIIILAVFLFYILPKLLSQLWIINNMEPKIKPEYLEKPLRVMDSIIKKV